MKRLLLTLATTTAMFGAAAPVVACEKADAPAEIEVAIDGDHVTISGFAGPEIDWNESTTEDKEVLGEFINFMGTKLLAAGPDIKVLTLKGAWFSSLSNTLEVYDYTKDFDADQTLDQFIDMMGEGLPTDGITGEGLAFMVILDEAAQNNGAF